MNEALHPKLKELVSKHFLFRHLEPHEAERLMVFARRQRFHAGDVIFRRGDAGSSMMSVAKGQIKISVSSVDGKEVTLAILGEGESLGEMAIFAGHERSADATALEDTELLVLEHRDVIPFLERHPEICIRLLGVLSERLRRTSELVEDRAFLSLPARLAKALLDLGQASGRQTQEGIRIGFKMSQKSFGAMLGASRESVNKQFRAWQSDGYLILGRSYVVLTRPDALQHIVDVERLGVSEGE